MSIGATYLTPSSVVIPFLEVVTVRYPDFVHPVKSPVSKDPFWTIAEANKVLPKHAIPAQKTMRSGVFFMI